MFTSIFSVSPHAQKVNLKEVITTAKQTLTKVTSSNVLERFSDYLTSLSYTNNPCTAPDSCQIAREFGIVIGAAGWEKLATTENIAKALKATHITFRCNITFPKIVNKAFSLLDGESDERQKNLLRL